MATDQVPSRLWLGPLRTFAGIECVATRMDRPPPKAAPTIAKANTTDQITCATRSASARPDDRDLWPSDFIRRVEGRFSAGVPIYPPYRKSIKHIEYRYALARE